MIYSRCKHSIIPGELISIKVVIGGTPLGCETTEHRQGERVKADPPHLQGGWGAGINCMHSFTAGRQDVSHIACRFHGAVTLSLISCVGGDTYAEVQKADIPDENNGDM